MNLNHPRVYAQEFPSVLWMKNQEPLELVKLHDPNVKNSLREFNFTKSTSHFYPDDMPSIVHVPIYHATNLIHHKE
jgi:hypothetical protein